MTLSILISPTQADEVRFSGTADELRRVLDEAEEGSTVLCDSEQSMVITKPLVITKALSLHGLHARLPKKLGRTQMIIVQAEDVELADIELHGNYDSVSQDDRAPMIWLQKSGFDVKRCKFYDGSKDGIMVTPPKDGDDIVGGKIHNIKALRMGRDAVSISGGNKGAKVRDVVVEDVELRRGYLRGAVEVSDGTDHITVRRVYAENAIYAIDVQDHRGKSAANTNILIEDVHAVKCRHIIRTANSPRGHRNLTLRKLVGKDCKSPVQIFNTDNVLISELRIDYTSGTKLSPVNIKNCRGVSLTDVRIEGIPDAVTAVQQSECEDVTIDRLSRDPE